MKGGEASPHELLDLARGLVCRVDPSTAGLWPRAAALLARRALEASVLGLWQRRTLDLESCSMRAQLICLRTYLGDSELAARAGHAWSALNRACHHHTYELAPTAWELDAWFTVVGELIHRIGSSPAEPLPALDR
jgi:hypothetical protein